MFRAGIRSFLGHSVKRSTAISNTRVFVRFQSSSSNSSQPASATLAKKKLALLEQQRQSKDVQENLLQDSEDHKETESQNAEHQQQQQQHQQKMQQHEYLMLPQLQQRKIRKGFSSVIKVPSTISIKPKDLLLDNLFQGYRPLTLPLVPPPLSKRPTVVYFEFDDNLDLLENGLNEIASGSSGSNNNNGNLRDPEDILKDKNLTRYQYSNYSFNKDEYSGPDDLFGINKSFSDHVSKASQDKLAKRFNDSYKMSKRIAGRRRMQYVHKKHKVRK
ncbi:hypothetical protein FOA43_000694 [Brettanomyces nanus]|uniref:Uncharacterized protein n=1 Tax=Eeniella nana TaxID=13502 RepID=A0A875S1Y0_EENNA|nr:uncharacterized protein FOA43_000694 [Brettanomyces nanus]QPG73384.1 hypothetical protein FOA43_000694 [Brettanomyces nanus]